MSLQVTVYESPSDDDPQVFEGVDFVSYVSPETYGPPALIAPARGSDREPRARVGQTVLYINTRLVPMWEIERTSD